MGSVLALGLSGAQAQEPSPQTVSPQVSAETTDVAEPATEAAAPPSFLPPDRRSASSEIEAFLTSPESILDLISAGWLRQGRVAELASSDLRTVRAMVDYARNGPSGTVLDIGAGLQRAARDADRAGSPGYGLAIQEIVAESDVPALNRAYAMSERSLSNVPETAALGAGGGASGGGASGGTVSGSNFGAAGGTGGAGGDDVVETRLGSYPVYGGGALSAVRTGGGGTSQLVIVVPASPAD